MDRPYRHCLYAECASPQYRAIARTRVRPTVQVGYHLRSCARSNRISRSYGLFRLALTATSVFVSSRSSLSPFSSSSLLLWAFRSSLRGAHRLGHSSRTAGGTRALDLLLPRIVAGHALDQEPRQGTRDGAARTTSALVADLRPHYGAKRSLSKSLGQLLLGAGSSRAPVWHRDGIETGGRKPSLRLAPQRREPG